MTHRRIVPAFAVLAASLAVALPAVAADDEGWSGTGELGLAVARGNAESENLNARLNFVNESEDWKHKFFAAALRNKSEVTGDFDGDGVVEERLELSANRYELGASSAYKMNEVSSWVAALRYENDDFAPFEHQSTFSLGYGRQWIDSEATQLATEVGPGYRRAKLAGNGGETETDLILRGVVDYSHQLTDTTQLVNSFLVESGDDNTFAQNDFGVAVKINAAFALKAGIQVRHNTDVQPGIDKTDTLTTVNLVYTFK